MTQFNQIVFERHTLQPTAQQPVYKLTIDLARKEVIWQGREHVQTRGKVVAELNEVQLNTLRQMLEDLQPETLAKAYESEAPQATYEALTFTDSLGQTREVHNAYGRYCANPEALEQTLAKVPSAQQTAMNRLLTFTFKIDQLIQVHQLIGQAMVSQSENVIQSADGSSTTELTLTEHILPQLTLKKATNLLAKLQKRAGQLTQQRNLQGIWERLQGMVKLRDELAQTFAQAQQRQQYLDWFQNMQKGFANSVHPYDQVIWEDLQEATDLYPVKAHQNTHQIRQMLEYVLGKNHPKVVHTYIQVLEEVKHRLTA